MSKDAYGRTREQAARETQRAKTLSKAFAVGFVAALITGVMIWSHPDNAEATPEEGTPLTAKMVEQAGDSLQHMLPGHIPASAPLTQAPDQEQQPEAPTQRRHPTPYTPGANFRSQLVSHMRLREGCRNHVYLDSRNKPTYGIGHLVTSRENLKVGDYVSDEHIMRVFERDLRSAQGAAEEQIAIMCETNPHFACTDKFMIALISVNFQMGTDWTTEFYSTWPAICRGDYTQAIGNLEKSAWNRQTPVRVDDFQDALRALQRDEQRRRTPTSFNISDYNDQKTATAFNDQAHDRSDVIGSIKSAGFARRQTDQDGPILHAA